MREQDRDGSMLHDMTRHPAKKELPVMAVRVGAHDDEPGLVRACLGQQACAGRAGVIGSNPVADDAMPTQVTQQLLRVGGMLALRGSEYLHATLACRQKRQGESN